MPLRTGTHVIDLLSSSSFGDDVWECQATTTVERVDQPKQPLSQSLDNADALDFPVNSTPIDKPKRRRKWIPTEANSLSAAHAETADPFLTPGSPTDGQRATCTTLDCRDRPSPALPYPPQSQQPLNCELEPSLEYASLAQATAASSFTRYRARACDMISSDPFRSSSPASEHRQPRQQTRDPIIEDSSPQRLRVQASMVRNSGLEAVVLDESNDDSEGSVQRHSSEELPDPTTLSRWKAADTDAPRRRSGSIHRLKPSRGSGAMVRTRKKFDPLAATRESVPSTKLTREATCRGRRETKQRKRAEREAKAEEKRKLNALIEVNKATSIDRKASTREMVVLLPENLEPALSIQTRTLLAELGVETQIASGFHDVLRWKRKVASEFNNDLRVWEPVPLRYEYERFCLVVLTAEELMKRLGDDCAARDLAWQAAQLERKNPGHQIIFLFEGIALWMRKTRITRNRRFTSAVRKEATDSGIEPQKHGYNRVTEDCVEDALLQLQLHHQSVLVHHTETSADTAAWIITFTQHISTIRYRRNQDSGIRLCIDPGQVRSGEDSHDTYVRLLQEIPRVTASIAWGVAAKYGTVSKLVDGFCQNGPLALEHVPRRSRDGTETDKAVGQAISKRLHSIFTSLDEGCTQL